ncbi:MAG: alpha-1,2-fucosyltransferase [Oscillospiraceae bacterium]|nr:alpha-1,2-fucosyltransferase [Oscillospiraceae bacterium]
MIFVEICCGLGNQLFTYAFFRWLQSQTGQPGLAYMRPSPLYHSVYQLDRFNITPKLAVTFKKEEFIDKAPKSLQYYLDKSRIPKGKRAGRHDDLGVYMNGWNKFEKPPNPLKQHYYINGFFQSPKFFESIKRTIVSEITLAGERKPSNKETMALIGRRANPVCVHVRRGDFVSRTHYNGICTVKYYDKAVEMILDAAPDARFFVFSDGMDWVRKSLAFPQSTVFVENNSEREAAEELEVMKACKHFIISNSTFSWWAQYLGAGDGSMVIAPNKFDAHNHKSNIIMDNWRLLNSEGGLVREGAGGPLRTKEKNVIIPV